VWGQPGNNSSPQDDKQLVNVRLNMAKQYMPTLAELMPQLFDLNQSYHDMVQIYNGKPLQGIIPSNWFYFLRGPEGHMDNQKAVQTLNQEIDALAQKKGLEEEIVGDDPEEYRGKAEQLKQTIDKLFNEQHFDVIDTLYRLLVARKSPVVAPLNEEK
jgi:hypothetical protein